MTQTGGSSQSSFSQTSTPLPHQYFFSSHITVDFFTAYPECTRERETWLSAPDSPHVANGAARCHSQYCLRAGETRASGLWHSLDSSVPRLTLCHHTTSSSVTSTDLGTSLMERSGHWGVLEHQSMHAICSYLYTEQGKGQTRMKWPALFDFYVRRCKRHGMLKLHGKR